MRRARTPSPAVLANVSKLRLRLKASRRIRATSSSTLLSVTRSSVPTGPGAFKLVLDTDGMTAYKTPFFHGDPEAHPVRDPRRRGVRQGQERRAGSPGPGAGRAAGARRERHARRDPSDHRVL